MARWFADENKRDRLAEILSDVVLAEAIDIVAAGQREEYAALRSTAPDLLLARRDVESGAVAQLFNALAALSAPPPKLLPHQVEWDHVTADPESSIPNPQP